jgi:hypothetical protein
MERAAGVRAASLGENPANVANYSQLALLREADQVKRQPILYERKLGIKQLVEDSVFDIRTYWGADKQVFLAGEEERVEAEVFNATKIPSFYMVKVAKGTAKPRSQAAELQKITDIWNAALPPRSSPPTRRAGRAGSRTRSSTARRWICRRTRSRSSSTRRSSRTTC